MLKEGKKEKIIGITVLAAIIVIVILIKVFSGGTVKKYKTVDVYGAVGGGKEKFMADEDFHEILRRDYGVEFVVDSWSNGASIRSPLIREYVKKGNESIIRRMENGENITINTEGATKYDLLFTSDQRYYDYYKNHPVDDEAERFRVLDGGLTLNTPIVIYSWDVVTDALINEGIVTEKDGTYYITDMNKLIDYVLEGKKWSDIGLDNIYGYINIASTDPVTSSPGATYYGLLLSIMSGGDVNTVNINDALPKLKRFYEKSGYMNNTPADLFELYLKTGVGSKPMIVDYEKSIIEFMNSNPDGYEQVKDHIRILYPTPTIWNSHCIATFTENGNEVLKAFNQNKEIQQLAWSKYGFRVGITGGNYDVTKVGIKGIPQTITSTTSGLRMDVYNKLEDYLSN